MQLNYYFKNGSFFNFAFGILRACKGFYVNFS